MDALIGEELEASAYDEKQGQQKERPSSSCKRQARVNHGYDGEEEEDVMAEMQLADMTSVLGHIHRRFVERRSDGETTTSGLRALKEMAARIEKAKAGPPQWTALKLSETDVAKPSLASLFGCLEGGSAGSGWFCDLPGSSAGQTKVTEVTEQHGMTMETEEKTSSTPDDREPTVAGKVIDSVILRRPAIVKQFLGKTKKEFRDIGVVDVAVTSAGKIIIVDKHNKLVKMFDPEGKFLRFVGRKLVKAPSRVTVLSRSGQILITDNSSKSLKMFSPEGGSYLGPFAEDLDHPISHCELFDEKIAVVDFFTRNNVIYERSGRAVHYFETGLQCPAYVGGTRNGTIVVSDWRSSKVRIYDAVGELITELNPTNQSVDTPYGVCGDMNGYLIVSEKSHNGIRIFHDDGTPVTNLSQQDFGFKLPMAVCRQGDDSLVSVDYQGLVKVIKYAEAGISQNWQKTTLL